MEDGGCQDSPLAPSASEQMKRFWDKVDVAGQGECWMWTAAKDADGYGRFGYEGKMTRAHRVSYTLRHGEIPKGLLVLHRCDTPACVNPAHLFVGTAADNMRDCSEKGRKSQGDNHHSSKLTDADVRAIREAHAEGVEYRELARKYGVSRSNIWYVVSGQTWRRTSAGGGTGPPSKLTADQVRAIRAASDAGVGQRALAREYGVVHGTIQKIIKRVNWRHLDPIPDSEESD